jgi:Flp pilus assembly protein TadD
MILLFPVVAAAEVVDGEASVVETQTRVLDGMIDAGFYTGAISLCSDLRAQGVTGVWLDVVQARALNLSGLHEEAEDLLDGTAKQHRRDARVWALLGVVRADRGDLVGAEDALERANRFRPEDPGILNNLGFVTMSAGKLEDAVRWYRASLLLDPAQSRTRNNLGFALARQEKDADALVMFRSAGTEAEANYNMGVACEWRGDNADAILRYQAALEASPGYPPAVEALKRLEGM